MPGLVAFSRKWRIASDDLLVPFGVSFCARSIWIGIVASIIVVHKHHAYGNSSIELDCSRYTDIFMYCYIGSLLVANIIDFVIAFLSRCGLIFEPGPRRHISIFLHLRAIWLFIELVWACLGFFLVFHKGSHCPSTVDRTLSKIVVILSLIFVLGCLLCIYLFFDATGRMWHKLHTKEKRKEYESVSELDAYRNEILLKYEKGWIKACRLLFCCTHAEQGKDNVLLFIAKTVSEYFHGYEDLVPSDILAGMILLRQYQKREEVAQIEQDLVEKGRERHEETIRHERHKSVMKRQHTQNSSAFNLAKEEDVACLDNVAYFSKYALACYGWPMYCFLHNVNICATPGCRLAARLRCCSFCRNVPDSYPEIVGDNCCHCHFAAQKSVLDIGNDHFIYISVADELYQTPFYVVVDHFRRSIVIACRGTLSLKDVMTDLTIDEDVIPVDESNASWTCHRGFLKAAMSVRRILEQNQLIEKAQAYDKQKGTDLYAIVIVGHSLGAGTATLLAFLLRPKYPQLHCYAYGPSGSAVSREASKYAEDFIHSVVLGKDIIARLNVNTMYELKENILRILRATKLPKWKILRGCMCQCLLCCSKSSNRSFEYYFSEDEQLIQFEPSSPIDCPHAKLFMAGKVVHICKTKSVYPRYVGKKRAEFRAYWSTPEDFQHILISNLMLKDHFPDNLMFALHSVLPEGSGRYVSTAHDDDGSLEISCVCPDVLHSTLDDGTSHDGVEEPADKITVIS